MPKFTDYNKKHILFILSVLLKTFNNFGYSTSMCNIENLNIKLPIATNGKIDFDFMENFIDKIEQKQRGILEFYKHKKQNGGGMS